MKIIIASPIDDQAIETLKEEHDVILAYSVTDGELRKIIHDRDVLVFRSGVKIDAELLNSAPALKLIVRAGSFFFSQGDPLCPRLTPRRPFVL